MWHVEGSIAQSGLCERWSRGVRQRSAFLLKESKDRRKLKLLNTPP
jgi:hypothetical protein